MAIYPGHSRSLAALGIGARIAIPNDPVNHDRALMLLERAGLLQLTHDANSSAVHVASNQRRLKLIELDAAQLPRSLDDVDAAVINANFALDAGLNPGSGSLFSETRDSPYANVLATNAGTESNPHIQALARALGSTQARSFITAHYGGAVYQAE
jgi:D-methionine transport system substrate-binding protein